MAISAAYAGTQLYADICTEPGGYNIPIINK